MATLGDILGSAKRSAAGFQRWIEAADPDLAEEVRVAAAHTGDSFAGLARAAVADFSRFADEDDWAKLTRIIRDDEDPGTTCLMAMVRWRLTATSCATHSVPSPIEDRS